MYSLFNNLIQVLQKSYLKYGYKLVKQFHKP